MRYNKETIRKGVIMNPFAQVRKVPLYYSGVQSNAYSVQTYDLNKKKDMLEWKEVGNVTDNYLLVENSEVQEMADDVMTNTGFEWEPLKRFWDG